MKAIRYTLLLVLLAGLAISTGCSKKLVRESELDTPAYHVRKGIDLLDRGDLEGARMSFERAKELDDDFAEAYAGLAIVEAKEGEFGVAHDRANQAIRRDKKNPWCHVARARVYLIEKRKDTKHWLGKVEDNLEEALELNPRMSEAYYWWGVAYRDALMFNEAGAKFSEAIAFKDKWAEKADKQYEIIQKIQRAAPGTEIGKIIALLPEITRADLAVLFMEELKLREVLQKHRPVETMDDSYVPPVDRNKVPEPDESDPSSGILPKDVRDNWAQAWIKDVIELDVMEVSPDNKFYPDRNVTRAEFAVFLMNILIDALHEPDLINAYIGERSRFKDIAAGTAAYIAAAVVVDRGIMDADLDGRFHPMETVSGADALLTIRKFQNRLRMEF